MQKQMVKRLALTPALSPTHSLALTPDPSPNRIGRGEPGRGRIFGSALTIPRLHGLFAPLSVTQSRVQCPGPLSPRRGRTVARLSQIRKFLCNVRYLPDPELKIHNAAVRGSIGMRPPSKRP